MWNRVIHFCINSFVSIYLLNMIHLLWHNLFLLLRRHFLYSKHKVCSKFKEQQKEIFFEKYSFLSSRHVWQSPRWNRVQYRSNNYSQFRLKSIALPERKLANEILIAFFFFWNTDIYAILCAWSKPFLNTSIFIWTLDGRSLFTKFSVIFENISHRNLSTRFVKTDIIKMLRKLLVPLHVESAS